MSFAPSAGSEPSDLYSPLNDQNEEIRLLVLEGFSENGLLRCSLMKASLKDYRTEYAEFLVSAGGGKTARRVLAEWADRSYSYSDRSNTPGQKKCEPSPAACRFAWGDFAALSYVWGDETLRRDITLNGTVVSVTRNLEGALRAMAENDEFRSSCKIWVDAICINQEDEVERARQIRRMRDIYSTAWTVIAWLGDADSLSPIPDAFLFLRILGSLQGSERDLRRLFDGERGLFTPKCFFVLHELMCNDYWTRLWIIQEIVMGASSTILRCGSHLLEWDSFCAAIAVLYHADNWTLKDRMLDEAMASRGFRERSVWQTMSVHLVHKDLRLMSRYEKEGGDRLGFRRLLEVASSADCRDVRDKVFALTGMMEPEIANEAALAYSQDIPTLFAKVTKAFITRYNNLEPLRQANLWGLPGAPTWAADWEWTGRVRWSRPETNFTGPMSDSLDPEPKPDTIYSAHGCIPAKYSFLDNDRLLRCDGFIVDAISGLGATEDGYFKWNRRSKVQHLAWKSAYGDNEATARALYSALMGGRTNKGARVEDRHSVLRSLPSTFRGAHPQFEDRGWKWLANRGGYYYKWENWRRAHRDLMLGGRPLGSYFTDYIPQDATETDVIEAYCAVDRTVQERRFMLTRDGRFGWAPDDMYRDRGGDEVRVGDLVVVLYGCSTPLIVRRVSDYFQVVGEAYVEGIMDGEAMRLCIESERIPRTFVFC